LEQHQTEAIAASIGVISNYGLSVVGAIIIFVVGWITAGWVSRLIRRAAERSDRFDTTLGSFFASIAKYAILAFTLIAVLSRFGVETTSFVALLGALGLAIGLALQGTLGHIASGVMLIIFRPFKIGDFVDTAGVSGTVKTIGLFTTELATGDNVQVIVPNGAVWGGTIKNFSGNATRRVDMVMGIGYGSSIDLAIKTMKDIIDGDSRIHSDPEPFFVTCSL
ncbi:MAG: mechanosensitive ion channel, partial [Gammaproteobacteria bacterium]|nr:mechanosensitive ion channel [Gammaproteobacteria bacterium]